MDVKRMLEVVDEFCDIVLIRSESIDSLSLAVDKREKIFIDSIDDFVKTKPKEREKNAKIFNDNIEVFHYLVQQKCLKYETEMVERMMCPYRFCSTKSLANFKRDLSNYCISKNGNLPECLSRTIDWILLDSQRFNLNTIYINNRIDANSEYQESVFKDNYGSLRKGLNTATKDLKSLNKSLNDYEKRIKVSERKMAENSITILGIFSAVVLTFNMGISFAAEALETFMQSSVYHSILVILLFGFIIGNVIFALFAFLRYIHKDDPAEKLHKTIIGKIVIIFNVVLAVLMIINIICWDNGAIERRDKDISSKYGSEQTTVEETTTEPTISQDIDAKDEDALK